MSKGRAKEGSSSGHGLSVLGTFVHNIPYAGTILLGAVVIFFSLEGIYRWLFSGLFMVYGMVSTLWFILFLCTHCHSYGSRGCHSGFGRMAAKLRPRGDVSLFRKKFKTHMPVVVPSWVVPVIVGIVSLAYEFSLLKLILIGAFVLISFVILPLMSKNKGCSSCPQREDCPWMGN